MKPITRKEKILDAILSGNTDNIPTPITREETYLKLIAENGSGGGGESTGIWKPSVSDEGVISWEKSTSTVTPEEQNIKGPKGDTGAQGETGATGETGPAGPGLASGGVAGSLLFKSSNDDYATEWVDSGIATVEGNPVTAETDSAGIGVKTVVDIEPQQDLHGYDAPWVGGAGKNLLPMTVEAIKAANTSGTWSGNAYTVNGVTFTIQTDSEANVTGINANGTASDIVVFILAESVSATQNCILTGGKSADMCIQSRYTTQPFDWAPDNGSPNGTVVAMERPRFIFIHIYNSTSVNSQLFKPMLRLSTETDSTFAPYSNICPISGWDEANVTRTGKNLFDGEILYGYYDESGFVSSSDGWKAGNLIKCYPDTNYIASFSGAVLSNGNVFFYDKNKNYISYTPFGKFPSFKTPNNSEYFGFYLDTTSMPLLQQIELGNTATEYEPYNGHTYTIDFVDGSNPLTVYGGTLDVESGLLTVDKGYIASYNGETLPSTWISDRDVYVEGTSPTTGAQVVYELATPYTISLPPHQIKLLQGVNNLSTNAHSVSLTYRKGKVAMNSDLEGLADSVNVLADEVDSFGIKPLTATALSDAVTISTFSAMKINKNVIFSCRVVITPTEEGSMPLFAINGVECPFEHTAKGTNSSRGIEGRWAIAQDTNILTWTVVSTELDKSNDILIQGVLAVK